MNARTKQRSAAGGFALPAAVFSLVVLGVLVTGGFFMARQEMRIGQATQSSSLAFYFAEEGLNQVMANWDASAYGSLGMWNDTTVTGATSGGDWAVNIMPMSTRLYFLDATGTVSQGGKLLGGANRRVGVIARVLMPTLEPPAALATVGKLKFGGSAIIDGRDTEPYGWSGLCNDKQPDKPGIMTNDMDEVDFSGNETKIREQQLFGSVDIEENTSMTSDSILSLGDIHFDELVKLADKVHLSVPSSPAPSSASGVCSINVTNNWGEPLSQSDPCASYFPIIYLKNPNQTWNFSGGRGQGILLVEGSMKVTGQFQFFGPIIIKGTLSTSGGGGVQHFYGGVMAANVDLQDNSVLGTADIVFSSCAIERAVLGNKNLTQARPLAQRSWIDLSSVSDN